MRNNRLIEAFVRPESVASWLGSDWGLALRQARSANLIGLLGAYLAEERSGMPIPEAGQRHFLAASHLIAQRSAAVAWESKEIVRVLAQKKIDVTFLKGAAYVLAGLPLAACRHFSDIDIMVSPGDLPEAEKSLMLAGWVPNNGDSYDQRYYRQWMHEVPPLCHIRRGTVLDLHHAITPPTSRYRARSELLAASRLPVPGLPGAYVLGHADMVLHAAAHLFAEGESENGLRNLLDVSELINQFLPRPGFESELIERSIQIGLSRPLYYAVRYLVLVLGQGQGQREGLLRSLAPRAPGGMALAAMDAMYLRVFQGGHPSSALPGESIACFALYLRGHWLRMPFHLLVPHLGRKLLHSLGPAALK
jgi:hypothetical protein